MSGFNGEIVALEGSIKMYNKHTFKNKANRSKMFQDLSAKHAYVLRFPLKEVNQAVWNSMTVQAGIARII